MMGERVQRGTPSNKYTSDQRHEWLRNLTWHGGRLHGIVNPQPSTESCVGGEISRSEVCKAV